MKKILYLLLLIVALISTITIVTTPIYKFDVEQVKKYNSELVAQIMEPTFLPSYRNNLKNSGLSNDSQEEYKHNYYIYNNLAYAIINSDAERFYQFNDYEVLNAIYKTVTGKDGTLTNTSTDEEVKLIEKVLVDLKGEEEINELKTKEIEKELVYYKEQIYQRVKDSNDDITSIDQVEDYITDAAISHVLDELFLLYLGYDQDLIDMTLADVKKDGIYLKNILTTFSNAFTVDKAVWNKYSSQDISFVNKLKSTVADDEFYNPFPILLLGLIIFIVFLHSVILIFSGIKGLRGRKYPHTFIKSIIVGLLCLGLLVLKNYISLDYFLKYHSTEYSRLISLFFFGNFDVAVIIALGANVVTVGISILGRLCRWKKKKTEN